MTRPMRRTRTRGCEIPRTVTQFLILAAPIGDAARPMQWGVLDEADAVLKR